MLSAKYINFVWEFCTFHAPSASPTLGFIQATEGMFAVKFEISG